MATCAVATKLLVVQQQWNLLCQRQFAPNISMPVISVAPASCRPWVAEKSIPAGDAVETGNTFRAHGRGYSAGMGFQVTEVQKCLAGFNYPGSPTDLADHAQKNGADSDLVETLRGLDKDSFDGPNAVMSALGSKDALGGGQ